VRQKERNDGAQQLVRERESKARTGGHLYQQQLLRTFGLELTVNTGVYGVGILASLVTTRWILRFGSV
jgi:hypothetical protein